MYVCIYACCSEANRILGTLKPHQQLAYLGDTVIIKCYTDTSVTWSKKDGVIENYRSSGDYLILYNVNYKSSGIYVCNYNVFVNDTSKYITSKVLVGGEKIVIVLLYLC